MKQSILYLTYDGLSDPLGQSQILPNLNGLVEKGREITVISFEKNTTFGLILNHKVILMTEANELPLVN